MKGSIKFSNFLILMLFLLIFWASFVHATPISSCTTISSPGMYELTTSLITSSGDCIAIDADDVTFDCMGNLIEHTNGTRAIIINRANNATVQNCVIRGLPGLMMGDVGIGGVQVTNTTIRNNSIYEDLNGRGITGTFMDSSITDNYVEVVLGVGGGGIRGGAIRTNISNNQIHGIGSAPSSAGISVGFIDSQINNNLIDMHGQGVAITSDVPNGTNVFRQNVLSNAEVWTRFVFAPLSNDSMQFFDTTYANEHGSIRFPGLIDVSRGFFDVTQNELNISHNLSYVDSAALPEWNQSAQITLNNLSFTNPAPIIDRFDTGNFADCLSPECEEVSYQSGMFVFNVTHFTSYSAKETVSICSFCGDGNGDGRVDILDTLLAAQIDAGIIAPTPLQSACLDVDSSGSVSIIDALQIARVASGISVSLMCV